MAVNDILRATMVCRFGDQVGLNVKYFKTVSETGSVSWQDVTNQLEAIFAPIYKGLITASAEWRGLQLQRVSPITYVPTSSVANAGSGTALGEPLPRQTCGLITLRTGLAGRAYRGRVYVPFPAEADNLTGIGPQSGYLGRLAALADLFERPITLNNTAPAYTIGLHACVYSTVTGLATVFTSHVARTGWATQRRRGSFGQPNPIPIP